MDRYEGPDDAIPHEVPVLVLNETDDCFGRPPVELFERVRSEMTCDKLLVEEHYRSLDDLPDYHNLVQYPVWAVHHSCLLAERSTQLELYLRTGSLPDETQVLVLLDTEDERMARFLRREIASEYGDGVTVIRSETALVYYLLGHLQTATPCSSAGLDYVLSWNNKISDIVGPWKSPD